MSRTPTKAQLGLIMHFAGMPNDVRFNQQTYRVCREQGWIRETEEWPYHETTDTGRQFLPALPI